MNGARVLGTDDDGTLFVKWTSGNTGRIANKGVHVQKGTFPTAFRPTQAQRKADGIAESVSVVLDFPAEAGGFTVMLADAEARATQHALAIALGNGVNGPTLAEQIWAEAVKAYEEMSRLEKGSSRSLAQGRAQGLAVALGVLLSRGEMSIKHEVKKRSKRV